MRAPELELFEILTLQRKNVTVSVPCYDARCRRLTDFGKISVIQISPPAEKSPSIEHLIKVSRRGCHAR